LAQETGLFPNWTNQTFSSRLSVHQAKPSSTFLRPNVFLCASEIRINKPPSGLKVGLMSSELVSRQACLGSTGSCFSSDESRLKEEEIEPAKIGSFVQGGFLPSARNSEVCFSWWGMVKLVLQRGQKHVIIIII